MGVIRTDQWLQEEFERPIRICEKLIPYFRENNASEIYNLLAYFGMYKPSSFSRNNLTKMEEQQVWEKVERIFTKYSRKWDGPDIPIFLFPLAHSGSFFVREVKNKAGVSFPDKMFLFLSNYEDTKEIEALFVHEYHHVCRMHKLAKKVEDFTLMDSLIMEGLAEYAVLKSCGQEYLAGWCRMYTESELSRFWERYIQNELDIKKNDRRHDELLYGRGRFPTLLGYAVGYNIIGNYYKKHNYFTKLSFITPAAKYLE